MPLQQLFVLAVGAMVLLAVIRVVRVRSGRTPHPEGMAKLLFGLAFVFVPPIALGALAGPGGESGLLTGLASVPLYAILLVGLMIVMRVAAAIVAVVVPRRARRLLLLALVANDDDPHVPVDPPVTPQLAAMVALVGRRNDVFPRGGAFAAEIDRSGFRASWDALDTATGTLEDAMAEDKRLGRGVALTVAAAARDARRRLNTLRELAVEDGQSWVEA